MSKSYNQRQRKKLRIGEFAELGFEIHADIASSLSRPEQDQFLEALQAEILEPQGLLFGGGFDEDSLVGYFMTAAARGSTTEAQRSAVDTWLKARKELTNPTTEALSDAWHGWTLPLHR